LTFRSPANSSTGYEPLNSPDDAKLKYWDIDVESWKDAVRDPERIPRILRKLGELWLRPGWHDMRLGQLIANVQSMGMAGEDVTSRRGDVFAMEDDRFEEVLDDVLAAESPQIPWQKTVTGRFKTGKALYGLYDE